MSGDLQTAINVASCLVQAERVKVRAQRDSLFKLSQIRRVQFLVEFRLSD